MPTDVSWGGFHVGLSCAGFGGMFLAVFSLLPVMYVGLGRVGSWGCRGLEFASLHVVAWGTVSGGLYLPSKAKRWTNPLGLRILGT